MAPVSVFCTSCGAKLEAQEARCAACGAATLFAPRNVPSGPPGSAPSDPASIASAGDLAAANQSESGALAAAADRLAGIGVVNVGLGAVLILCCLSQVPGMCAKSGAAGTQAMAGLLLMLLGAALYLRSQTALVLGAAVWGGGTVFAALRWAEDWSDPLPEFVVMPWLPAAVCVYALAVAAALLRPTTWAAAREAAAADAQGKPRMRGRPWASVFLWIALPLVLLVLQRLLNENFDL